MVGQVDAESYYLILYSKSKVVEQFSKKTTTHSFGQVLTDIVEITGAWLNPSQPLLSSIFEKRVGSSRL